MPQFQTDFTELSNTVTNINPSLHDRIHIRSVGKYQQELKLNHNLDSSQAHPRSIYNHKRVDTYTGSIFKIQSNYIWPNTRIVRLPQKTDQAKLQVQRSAPPVST